MIVLPSDSRLRLITQPDHARLAAEILSLWHADGLPEHPRRADLLFAVAEHDNGWREADSAPYVDARTGRPHTFLDLPDGHRREIWSRGMERFAEDRPYPALLVLEHARTLHADRRPEADWESFFQRLDELRGELLGGSAVPERQLAADYRWLALADDLSLAVCGGHRSELEHGGYRARLSGDELGIEPFPLVGATTFRVACRYVPDRPYRGDADLGVELAKARWETLSVRLRPGR